MGNNVLQFKRPTKPTELNLTELETQVWQILASSIGDAKTIGEQHVISAQTVRNIKMLKTQRAERVYAKMLEAGVQAYTWVPAKRFNERQVAAIRASTETSDKLAKRFNCSPSTIRMIKTGKTYAN